MNALTAYFNSPLWLLPILAAPLWIYLLFLMCRSTAWCILRTALRATVLLLLLLTLAQPQFLMEPEESHTVFLIDRSQSMPRADSLPENLELLIRDTAGKGGASLVSFAEDSVVESTSLHPHAKIDLRGEVLRTGTDLEQAFNQALALIPEGSKGRVVLFSDGKQSQGSALRAADHLSAQSVPVTVLLHSDSSRDAGILTLSAPPEVLQGESHRLNIELVSSHDFDGQLQFYRNQEYLGQRDISVRSGRNYYSFVQRIETQGLHTYEVYLSGSNDLRPQNDYGKVSVFVPGKNRLLYVSEDREASRFPVEILELQGFQVEILRPGQLPAELAQYAAWDAVIFDNVPASALSFDTMLALDRYVRLLGGGFVMLGSDRSFGPGGYYKTPVERLLPVDMDISSSMSTPALTMIIVMDKSGSMGNASMGAKQKLDILKQSALSAVQVMNPYYSIGVLSFDADAQWIVPVTKAGERRRIMQDLARISPGGGTDLEVALQEALRVLRGDPAKVRHILVLSDGLIKPADYETLIGEIAAQDITVSSVSIGRDSNRSFMESLARQGGGRFYAADSIEEAPQIFITEARMVSRSLITEEPYFPVQAVEHPVLQGITAPLPAMRGGVLTYTKDEAQQIITGIDEYPLLSVRQYGLGRSAAFTSDLAGTWSDALLQHAQFPRLWGQLLRWCATPMKASGFFVRLKPHVDNSLSLECELRDATGAFINNARLNLSVFYSDRENMATIVPQTAPGRYSTVIPQSKSGDTILSLAARGGEDPAAAARYTRVLHRAYSPEFTPALNSDQSTELMQALAQNSGGRLVEYSENKSLYPEQLFSPATSDQKNADNRDSVRWHPLVLIALLLFTVECAAGIIRTHLHSLRRESLMFIRRVPGFNQQPASALSQIERQKSAETQRDFSFWFGRGYGGRSK